MLLPCSVFTVDQSTRQKIELSLSLHDSKDALLLLDQWQRTDKDFAQDPRNIALLFDYLAETQDIEGMRILFERFQSKQILELPQATLEKIAWTNIELASRAYHPKIRAEALLACAESQDVHGMRILHTMLTDTHGGIQQVALHLATNYPDSPIQQKAEEIATLGTPEAKLGAARLLATQKAPCAENVLKALLIDELLSEEDRIEVASLLGSLKDKVDIQWIQKSAKDPRPTFRALAASAVRSCPSKDGLLLLIPLLEDPSTHVKQCAFQTLGLFQSLAPELSDHLIEACTRELKAPSVSLSSVAAWALLLSSNEDAKKEASSWFENALVNGSKEKALIASSRLIRTGEAGLTLTKELIAKVSDPLARANLAQYLLIHRTSIPESSEILRHSLILISTLLEEQEEGLFSWIGASRLPHHPAMPRLPESEDLFLRLELLALQSYSGEKIDREVVEGMLSDRAWGISAAAAAFLFQEYGHSLDEVLAPLLSHGTEAVRIQAALLLTIISQSHQAAATLADQYEKASREGKEAIILGFSCLPALKTKQYLIPLLFNPSPVLRTRASGALLASLYR